MMSVQLLVLMSQTSATYSKAGLNQLDLYKGHYGMVTGLHFHPYDDFSDLFLTSSVDWMVKLWRAKARCINLVWFSMAIDYINSIVPDKRLDKCNDNITYMLI